MGRFQSCSVPKRPLLTKLSDVTCMEWRSTGHSLRKGLYMTCDPRPAWKGINMQETRLWRGRDSAGGQQMKFKKKTTEREIVQSYICSWGCLISSNVTKRNITDMTQNFPTAVRILSDTLWPLTALNCRTQTAFTTLTELYTAVSTSLWIHFWNLDIKHWTESPQQFGK